MAKFITEKEVREFARKLQDFDLFEASFSIDGAWKYLAKVTSDKGEKEYGKIEIAKRRSINKAVKDNQRRYNVCMKHIETDINKEFIPIYKQEAKLLEQYCYLALGSLLAEIYPEEWIETFGAKEEGEDKDKVESAIESVLDEDED